MPCGRLPPDAGKNRNVAVAPEQRRGCRRSLALTLPGRHAQSTARNGGVLMTTTAATRPAGRKRTAGLTLAALGVVFGDIGTSPLYTVQTCFSDFTGLKPTPDNVLGMLSLITWALIIVVTLKYVIVVTVSYTHLRA